MPQTIDVLVVDDEPEMLDIYLDHFENSGIPTVGTAVPSEAMKLFQDYPPRLVIVDHQMPRLSGLDWLEVATATKANFPATIVATAYSNIDYDLAARLGVGLVMFKPFQIQKLVSVIETTLGTGSEKTLRKWVRVQTPIEVEVNEAQRLILDIGMGGFRIHGRSVEDSAELPLASVGQNLKIPARKIWEGPTSTGFQFETESPTYNRNLGSILKWISEIGT